MKQPLPRKCRPRNYGDRTYGHHREPLRVRVSERERAWAAYFASPVGSLEALVALARVRESV